MHEAYLEEPARAQAQGGRHLKRKEINTSQDNDQRTSSLRTSLRRRRHRRSWWIWCLLTLTCGRCRHASRTHSWGHCLRNVLCGGAPLTIRVEEQHLQDKRAERGIRASDPQASRTALFNVRQSLSPAKLCVQDFPPTKQQHRQSAFSGSDLAT